jgi:ribosomal protein S18 acetylase RimI-like enzyme
VLVIVLVAAGHERLAAARWAGSLGLLPMQAWPGLMSINVDGAPDRNRRSTHYAESCSRTTQEFRDSQMGVEVAVATTITDDIVEAFVRLTPQLSSSSPAPTKAELQAICDHDACSLLIARDTDGTILGSMTLVTFPIPTGLRGWIEDVVVDEAARGKGVGEILNRTALSMASEMGVKTVDLTSRPSRVAANKLYQKLGFVARETNVYRYAEPAEFTR